MFTTVHHIALICSDYLFSKRFYTETLEFQVIREIFREERNSYKLDLDAGNGVQLELFSFPDPPPRPTRPEACGLRHLAFSTRNFDETIAKLKSKGVALEETRIDEFTGRRFAFFTDPDGLPLEVYEDSSHHVPERK